MKPRPLLTCWPGSVTVRSKESEFLMRPPVRSLLIVASAPVWLLALTSTSFAIDQTVEAQNNLPIEIILIGLLTTIGVGIFLGISGRAVVFRNYDDLALVFACFVALLVTAMCQKEMFILAVGGVLSLWLASMILVRTWRDNGLLFLPIMLLTKISLSMFWILYVMEAINPKGNSMLERSRNRGTALVFLAILTPVIARLVKNHEGFLTRSHA
jgi:hypothetical protein